MKIKYRPQTWSLDRYEDHSVESILKYESDRLWQEGQIESLEAQVKHLTETLARLIEHSKHLTAPDVVHICTGFSDDTATFVP